MNENQFDELFEIEKTEKIEKPKFNIDNYKFPLRPEEYEEFNYKDLNRARIHISGDVIKALHKYTYGSHSFSDYLGFYMAVGFVVGFTIIYPYRNQMSV
jgi:hypothetical protein